MTEVTAINPGMNRTEKIVVFATLLYLVCFVVFDYSKTWSNPEVAIKFLDPAIRTGKHLSFEDVKQSFDAITFSEMARARIINNFFYILNVKLRLWLWQYIPPHPSFSLTWLFTLFITPLLLYRILRDWLNSSASAWFSLLLLLVSTGYLSHVTLLNHPGKPLAVFLMVFCIYLAKKVQEAQDYAAREAITYPFFYVLLATIFLSLFVDELIGFVFVAIPLLFPRLFWPVNERWKAGILFVSPLILFLLIITFLLPGFTEYLGYERNYFWHYAISTNSFLDDHTLGWFFYVSLRNLQTFLSDQFTALGNPIADKVWLAVWGGIFLICFVRVNTPRKMLFLQLFTCLFLLVVVQTLIHTRHYTQLKHGYYYGGIFSLFFAMGAGVLLTGLEGKLRWLKSVVILLLIVMAQMGFYRASDTIMTKFSHPKRLIYSYNGLSKFRKKKILPPPKLHRYDQNAQVSFSKIKEMWMHRRSIKRRTQLRAELPAHAFSLEYEMTKID